MISGYGFVLFWIWCLQCLNLVSSFCFWTRCCINTDEVIDGLESNLTNSLFGQHLVNAPIVDALSAHLNYNTHKALVLSFHGPAGVGKTFVAQKIAYHLFNGEKYYVKFYSGRNDFMETKNLAYNKEKLMQDVTSTVSKCPHSIFIFDESDQMSDGLFDVLRPFMEYYDEYRGVDYRKAIFIFMSNIGASELADIYYKWPGKREDLKINHFEEVLSKWLFNKKGGFKESSLIVNFLVDYYIPFLPLDKEHIHKCIEMTLQQNGHPASSHKISFIYDMLPKKNYGSIEYVSSNCKRIASEVGKYISSLKRQRLRDEM